MAGLKEAHAGKRARPPVMGLTLKHVREYPFRSLHSLYSQPHQVALAGPSLVHVHSLHAYSLLLCSYPLAEENSKAA